MRYILPWDSSTERWTHSPPTPYLPHAKRNFQNKEDIFEMGKKIEEIDLDDDVSHKVPFPNVSCHER
jgi:hypothetical protein